MIVYIEDKNNNRVGYIIATGKTFDQYDILTGIDINHYSKILINLPASKRDKFIKRIDKLINYKIHFWNNYERIVRNTKVKTLNKELLRFVRSLCNDFDLIMNIRFVEELDIENI